MFLLILLYLILTIVRPQDYVPGLVDVPLLPVVLILAFLCWLASSAKTWAAPQLLILPAFLVVLMISQLTNGWAGGAIDELSRFGPTVIAFVVFATCCTTRERVTMAMRVFVLCSVVLALHGVEQARNGIGWTGVPLGEDGRIQYVGIFNDPNDLGLLFAATLPMAFFLRFRSRGILRLFWLAAAALLLYAIYLTNSRGAILAVLAIVGVYVWHRRGAITAIALSAAGLALVQMLSSRMSELDAGEESAHGRVEAWYEGILMFTSHPLFGVGPGGFTDYNDLTAHNSFVLVLAEAGFVGFTLWLAFVGYSFWMVLTVLRHAPAETASAPAQLASQAEERAMALSLFLSLCGLFAAAFFLSRSYMIVLYLIIALVTGYYVGARQRMPELRSFSLAEGWWRWVPTSMGSIVGLYVLTAVLMRTS